MFSLKCKKSLKSTDLLILEESLNKTLQKLSIENPKISDLVFYAAKNELQKKNEINCHKALLKILLIIFGGIPTFLFLIMSFSISSSVSPTYKFLTDWNLPFMISYWLLALLIVYELSFDDYKISSKLEKIFSILYSFLSYAFFVTAFLFFLNSGKLPNNYYIFLYNGLLYFPTFGYMYLEHLYEYRRKFIEFPTETIILNYVQILENLYILKNESDYEQQIILNRQILSKLENIAFSFEIGLPRIYQFHEQRTTQWCKERSKKIANTYRELKKWLITPQSDTYLQIEKLIRQELEIFASGNWHYLANKTEATYQGEKLVSSQNITKLVGVIVIFLGLGILFLLNFQFQWIDTTWGSSLLPIIIMMIVSMIGFIFPKGAKKFKDEL